MTKAGGEWTPQIVEHTRRLEEYKKAISRLFPALPEDLLDAGSLRDVDALVLALFLRCYPHELSVLEVGTSLGLATFHFAGQPSVSRVLSVDPLATEDTTETSSMDIARAALAEFADESVKIQFRPGDLSGASAKLAHELPENEPLLAYVGGARTREAVDADLQAVFDANPRAFAILDRCRGEEGPFVQAGDGDWVGRGAGERPFSPFWA